MKLLFLSWRDIKNPKKGGAEIFTHECLKILTQNGHEVTHFSPEFKNSKSQEKIDGIHYVRSGGYLSVILKAKKHYKKNKDIYDLIIDQSNTHQFFTPLWIKEKSKRVFFIHQLTREIWFYNTNFPLNILGYLLEPYFLFLHRKSSTITVSESTKTDLIKIGKHEDKNIQILPEGIDFIPWKKEKLEKKEKEFTAIYVGRFVKYKGVEDVIQAFSEFQKEYPKSKLWLVGKVPPTYQKKLEHLIIKKKIQENVIFWGFVSGLKKLELMSKSHCIIVPSQREGWGLIVTEANAVGTTSIVYNSPGLKDSVKNNKTGLICEQNSPPGIYMHMKTLNDSPVLRKKLAENAHQWSKTFSWKKAGLAMEKSLKKIIKDNAKR